MTIKTLGILGGGQLGRMSAQAAAKLGLECVIFTPEPNSPAAQVAKETIVAAYDDEKALKEFADKVDVITYEFENIPVHTVQFLKSIKAVYPDDKLLEVSQDRIDEKSYLNSIGIPTTEWKKIESKKDILPFPDKGLILKTARFGYDGKGQVKLKSADDFDSAMVQLKSNDIIAEQIVDFECEISVIVARDAFGTVVTYGPMLNHHKNHILDETIYPAPVSEDLKARAVTKTKMLAEKVNLRGVLTLEMFVTKDGRILANEIAPRTHNSGHWTIDACKVSQFENHVRAVCGLPVLAPEARPARMINLIGEDVKKSAEYKDQKNACVHLYGKQDVRAGRKMGHITFLGE